MVLEDGENGGVKFWKIKRQQSILSKGENVKIHEFNGNRQEFD